MALDNILEIPSTRIPFWFVIIAACLSLGTVTMGIYSYGRANELIYFNNFQLHRELEYADSINHNITRMLIEIQNNLSAQSELTNKYIDSLKSLKKKQRVLRNLTHSFGQAQEQLADMSATTCTQYSNLMFTIPEKWRYLKILLGSYVEAKNKSQLENLSDQIKKAVKDVDYDLLSNIINSISMHKNSNPCLKVYIFDDEDCSDALGQLYPQGLNEYKQINEGMYKGDMCRGVMLYKYGGLYLDIDVIPRINLLDYFGKMGVDFATSWEASRKGFFQAILYSVPKNDVLIRYLDVCMQWLVARKSGQEQKGVWMGTWALKKAYDNFDAERKSKGERPIKSFFAIERQMSRDEFDRGIYRNAFWQEGNRLCNHIVINEQTNEILAYSRYVGFTSDYC